MRNKRTNAEEWAIRLMTEELSRLGHLVVSDNSITDKPDWAFSLDGKKVAADCRNINPERLMRWSNTTSEVRTSNTYDNAVFPLEPHLWVQKSVEEKEEKIGVYLSEAKASEAWLILHSCVDEPYEWFDCNEDLLRTMTQAARAIQPTFDQIWYVHTDNQNTVYRIWKKGDPKEAFPEVLKNGRYPYFRVSKVNTVWLNDEPLSITEAEEELVVPPIDSRYSVLDY